MYHQMVAYPVLQNNKGFTLIEAMIALVIMAFIMLGTMSWMVGVYQTNLENAQEQVALKLTQELIENIRGRRYDSLANGTNSSSTTPSCTYERLVYRTPYCFLVTRNISEVAPDLAKRVRYNVQWDKNRNGTFNDADDGNITIVTIVGNKDE